MVQKILGKATSLSKKGRKKKEETRVWLSGRMHIEEQRTIERRAAASSVKAY